MWAGVYMSRAAEGASQGTARHGTAGEAGALADGGRSAGAGLKTPGNGNRVRVECNALSAESPASSAAALSRAQLNRRAISCQAGASQEHCRPVDRRPCSRPLLLGAVLGAVLGEASWMRGWSMQGITMQLDKYK